jgi:NitT/TauT family transport system ATP-binding protein
MSADFLRIEDLYKSYGEHLVLDNVDLAVRKGEFCNVVGPSGCGKSTLLRQVLGEESPDSGRVTMEGYEVGHPDTQRGIVFQRYSLFPHLSVLKNVMAGPLLGLSWRERGRRKREIREEAMRYLERMRLGEHADKYPYELSGGMQQRVAIAQSLIMKPRILMMDEPFGALDPDTREQLQVLLLELWEVEQMTIFFVTHDLEEAVYLGTRVLVLSQYYTDDRAGNCQRGAKIVADYQLPRAVNATDVKRDPAFMALVENIRHEGFDPQGRKHVLNFNLKHPDSFRTLTPEECRTQSSSAATGS